MKTKDLEIFIMTDQPETCPNCGVRTVFVELSNFQQIHVCENCNEIYLVEEE